MNSANVLAGGAVSFVLLFLVLGIGPFGRWVHRRNFREQARTAWGNRWGSTRMRSMERGDKDGT